MKSFTELFEGVYDPNIFKAFYMAGGPGSGKSFAVQKGIGQAQSKVRVTAQGLKVVNSDDIFEKYLKDAHLNFKMDANQGKQRDALRTRAKVVTKKRQDNYIEGRLGMVIDGTGKDYGKITSDAARLKQIGYDVHMIFVNTSLETALKRNAERERTVPRSVATKSWKTVQNNMGKFSQYFRQNFIVVDNNDSEEDVMGPVYKQVMSLAKKKVQNKTGLNWIQTQLDMKRR